MYQTRGKEFDTYKVGTVANSCSTMHTVSKKEIELDSFEIEDYEPDLVYWLDDSGDGVPVEWTVGEEVEDFIRFLERLREKYLETKDKKYWKELIRWMPNGWLQKRTVTLNYEVLRSMRSQRAHHKLTEWHLFCNWIDTLPYAEDLITYGLHGLEREND